MKHHLRALAYLFVVSLISLPISVFAQCGWAEASPTGGRLTRADNGQLLVYGSTLISYTPDGQQLWTRNVRANAAVPVADGFLIAGGFADSLVIDTLTAYETDGSAAYLAKLDFDGKVQWVRHWGGLDTSVGIKNTINDLLVLNNQIYATGRFVDTMVVGTDTLGSYTLASVTGQGGDAFLARFDMMGLPDTALRMGFGNDDYGQALADDDDDNVYLLGYFTDTIQIGIDTLYATGSLSGFNEDYPDYFLTRLNGMLTPDWAMNFGSPSNDACPGDLPFDLLAHAGRLFVSGTFHPGAEIGSLLLTPIGTACAPAAGLVSIDTSGVPLWARQIASFQQTGERAEAWDIHAAPDGTLYWAGTAPDSSLTSLSSDTLFTNNVTQDGFFSHLDTAGNWLSIKLLNGTGVDVLRTALPTSDDSLLLSGFFGDTLRLGSRKLFTTGFATNGFVVLADTNAELLDYQLPQDLELVCQSSYMPQLDSLAGTSYMWSPADSVSNVMQLNPSFNPSESTTYVLQASRNGCTSIDTLSITVTSPNFGVDFTAGPTDLELGDADISFTNETPNPSTFSFLWRFGDGNTSQALNPTHTYTDTGSFSITLLAVQTATGCEDSIVRPDFVFVADTASNDTTPNDTTPDSRAELAAAGINVYPNPVGSGTTLQVHSTQPVQQLTLTSPTGQRVPFEEGDLPAVAAGVYVLEIQRADGVYRMRLLAR